MKTLYYTFLITGLLLLGSCKSIDKLVDQGRYDDAIVLATERLAGKKKKKTKHIKALEEAFYKINTHDIEQLHRLKDVAATDGSAWTRVYDYVVRIDNRQKRVTPDVRPLLDEARNEAAAYLYAQGSEELVFAIESDDKLLARKAYHTFDRIGSYYASYKDIDQLLAQSHALGTTYILMNVEDYELNRELYLKMLKRMDRLGGMWSVYHIDPVDDVKYDIISDMTITDVFVSPEQEDLRTFTESKELERWVTERDEYGEVVRDTLGNEIKYKEVEIVRATLSEINRSKRTSLRAKVIVSDFSRGEILGSEDFRHEVYFASDTCDIRGDRRALTDDTRKRVDRSLSPFPSDFDMIDEALEEISVDIMNYMREWRTT